MISDQKIISLKKIISCILILVALAALITGCTIAGEPGEGQSASKPGNNGMKQTEQPDINLAVYFVKYDGEDVYLVREVHTVPYTEHVAEAAMQELIKDKKSIFPPGTEVLGVKIENGLATVNFNEKVLTATNVGSAGEALGIQSVVNTLTELPNIEKVAFQVEGKSDGRVRDWWGHVGLYDQPFTRDLSKVYEPAIWVTHPTPNQVAGVPLLVKGSARVFEAAVNARLLDQNGNLLAEGHTTATAAAPDRGDFEMSLKFDPPSSGKGLLEVFWTSPKDGSIKDKVSIPLQWP